MLAIRGHMWAMTVAALTVALGVLAFPVHRACAEDVVAGEPQAGVQDGQQGQEADPLDAARAKFIAKVDRSVEKYRGRIGKKLKSDLKELKAKAATASEKKLAKLEEKRKLAVERIKMRKYSKSAENWSSKKIEFVKKWGKRNNRYLKGSPMRGTGHVIAAAAYDYKTDPRLYSAIATIESGRGIDPAGCKYNVCGWICDTPSMHSWEDAAIKWHRYFGRYFKNDWYPIGSMHGYGDYGPELTNSYMRKI